MLVLRLELSGLEGNQPVSTLSPWASVTGVRGEQIQFCLYPLGGAGVSVLVNVGVKGSKPEAGP